MLDVLVTPALFTKISKLPNSSTVELIIFLMSKAFVTSVSTAIPDPCLFNIKSRVSLACFKSISAQTTL